MNSSRQRFEESFSSLHGNKPPEPTHTQGTLNTDSPSVARFLFGFMGMPCKPYKEQRRPAVHEVRHISERFARSFSE